MIRYDNVLCISDTHFPYHHEDTFDFLWAVREKYKPELVVHTGDMTDSYAFSRYPKDIDQEEGFTAEFRAVRRCSSRLADIFHSMIITGSNHDERLWERSKVAGVPRSVILPFLGVIGAGSYNWKLVNDLVVDISGSDWYFAHYRGANILRIASEAGMSVVQGHTHTKFSANSLTSLRGRIWGVEAGCLLGDNHHAFAYNKSSLIRPNLGCVLIERGVPRLIPMNTEGGRWDGKC